MFHCNICFYQDTELHFTKISCVICRKLITICNTCYKNYIAVCHSDKHYTISLTEKTQHFLETHTQINIS